MLVVFLALFQAILLSVFGIGAIRGQWRNVAEQLKNTADDALELYIVQRAHSEFKEHSNDVERAAFEREDRDWRDRPSRPGGGLFAAAFLVGADRSVRGPDGLPLWLPRDLAEGRAAADARAELKAGGSGGVAFALRHPFAREEAGGSLALLHATSPLLAGEGGAPLETLLDSRWVGLLNQVAGFLPAAEVRQHLARVDRAGGDDPKYRAGAAALDRRAGLLAALLAERERLPRAGEPMLYRPRDGAPFYVRPVGDEGDVHVLAVEPAALAAFLGRIAKDAQGNAAEGVRYAIANPGETLDESEYELRRPMRGLPGYVAGARISEKTVRERAAERARFYWYIIGVSIAGIVAGGLLTARVVRREVRLAKLKSGFVSNVSHGLKTPLTSIRMFSDMLRSGQVKEEAERQECLDVIAQETDRLSGLIQQVLDFGRLEARQRPFTWSVGSLAPVVAKEAERFRRMTGLDAECFTAHVAVNLPSVDHDAEAIGEAIANLLSNAYKYTPAEGRRIELTLGPQHGRVVLAVADNGPGVPASERKKIFEQFYRSGDLLTSEVEGTGLGLSITRNIVRAHGGRILVEDSELGGSRFSIVLPPAASAETT